MVADIRTADDRVRVWHASLRVLAVFNVVALVVVVATQAMPSAYGSAQVVCSGIFVAVCAYRCWFPVMYGPRYAIVDAWPSNVFLTRSLATVAELCLVAQVAWLLQALGDATGSVFVRNASALIVPLVAAAQVCCWYGVATRRDLGELLEESLWTLALGIAFVCFAWLAVVGGLRPTIVVGLIGIGVYLGFMTLSALPMYARRWQEDRQGADHSGVVDGLRDMATRRVPTRSWEHWGSEVAWMSLYFGPWVWLSIAMTAIDPATVF